MLGQCGWIAVIGVATDIQLDDLLFLISALGMKDLRFKQVCPVSHRATNVLPVRHSVCRKAASPPSLAKRGLVTLGKSVASFRVRR